ncbi:uncharacterized protein LOC132944514 [Metopolophium dirhodum]|uniref:uncharacterized protein LOC132944514 n=1 Tax=Metopolophium dirhodum TaxID=44670 RepID=UPI00298F4074|nr:uncharacterized protein LOC132944514 [Metopolophium dirhodum]
MDLQLLDDVEAVAVAYALHKRNKKQKTKLPKRRYWVHPINLKRPQEGQFNVNFMILRAHPEKFQMYYRMSIQSFDELISLIGPYVTKQITNMRIPISKEERLTITLR